MSERVALVVKYFGHRRVSGLVSYARALAGGLARHLEVHVVTARAPGGMRPSPAGVDVHPVGAPFPLAAGRAVRRLNPSAVVVLSGVVDWGPAVPYFAPLAASIRRVGRRVFYQATNAAAPPSRAFARVLGSFNDVWCAGTRTAELFRERVGEVRLVPPAVAVGPWEPRDAESPHVGFANHLSRLKGADIAMRAADALSESHPGVAITLAGTGELEDEVRRMARRLPAVRHRPFMEDEERLRLIASCDVMLLPMRSDVTVLGVSQAALEAMAAGGVVVGSNVPSVTDAVRDGREGVIASTPDAVVAGVRDLIGDRDALRELGARARRRVEEEYDLERRALEIARMVSSA